MSSRHATDLLALEFHVLEQNCGYAMGELTDQTLQMDPRLKWIED